jgi:hypothetical protein
VDEPWTLSALVTEVERRIAALPAPRNGQVRAIPDERTIRYYATIGLLDRPSAMRGRTALYGRKHVAQVIAIKRLQTMGRSLAEIQGLWPTLDDVTLARMSGVELPAHSKAPVRPAFWKRDAAPGGEGAGSSTSANPMRAAADDEPAIRGGAPRPGDAAIRSEAPPSHPAAVRGQAPRSSDAAIRGQAPRADAAIRGQAPRADAAFDAVDPAARVAGMPAVATRSASTVELRLELAPGAVLALSVDEGAAVTLTPAAVRALRAAAAPLLAELASRRLASHSGGEEP